MTDAKLPKRLKDLGACEGTNLKNEACAIAGGAKYTLDSGNFCMKCAKKELGIETKRKKSKESEDVQKCSRRTKKGEGDVCTKNAYGVNEEGKLACSFHGGPKKGGSASKKKISTSMAKIVPSLVAMYKNKKAIENDACGEDVAEKYIELCEKLMEVKVGKKIRDAIEEFHFDEETFFEDTEVSRVRYLANIISVANVQWLIDLHDEHFEKGNKIVDTWKKELFKDFDIKEKEQSARSSSSRSSSKSSKDKLMDKFRKKSAKKSASKRDLNKKVSKKSEKKSASDEGLDEELFNKKSAKKSVSKPKPKKAPIDDEMSEDDISSEE